MEAQQQPVPEQQQAAAPNGFSSAASTNEVLHYFCSEFSDIVYPEGTIPPVGGQSQYNGTGTSMSSGSQSSGDAGNRAMVGPSDEEAGTNPLAFTGVEASENVTHSSSNVLESLDLGDLNTDVAPTDGPRETYKMKKMIGRNPTTTVFLAERTSDGLEVAVKFVQLNDAKQLGYAQSEVSCLANCNHFCIIRQFECVMRKQTLLLVMEYGSGGDLAKQLKQRSKERLPFKEHEVGLLLLQIIMAVDHVHNKRMIHRDIKSANIFLMPTGIVKLGDFGLSKQYEESVSANVGTSFCGTPYYLAPEIWKRQRYNKKADMWSIGVVLYELIAMKRPFSGPAQHQIMDQVLAGNFDPLPEATAPELRDIVAMLLHHDPTQRPNTQQLLDMKFFKYARSIFEEIVTVSEVISPADKASITQVLAASRTRAANANASAVDSSILLSMEHTIRFGGYLQKLGSDRRWKKRYFAITNTGHLRISLSHEAEQDRTSPQSAPLDLIIDVMPVPTTYSYNHPYQLSVWFSTTKKIVATASSDEERDQWIQALQEAIGM